MEDQGNQASGYDYQQYMQYYQQMDPNYAQQYQQYYGGAAGGNPYMYQTSAAVSYYPQQRG